MGKVKPKTKLTRNNNESANLFINIQIFGILIYVVIFLLLSFVALIADISEKYNYLFALIIFALSSFSTGFYAGIKKRQNGLIVGIIYCLPINIIVLIISALICNFKVDFTLIISAAVLLLSAAIGGVLAVNKRHRR